MPQTPRDLTDTHWATLDSLIPEPTPRRDGRGRPWKNRRTVLNGILWVLRTPAAGREEVGDANPPLARSLEPLHDSVAGTNAGTGENRIMKAQNLSTSLGEGSDAVPSLAHPSPKTKPGRLRIGRRGCPIDRLQIGGHWLAHFPGHIVQRSPHHMHDAERSVRTVVWQGSVGDRRPYADQTRLC
jgi:hypothetical protein